MLHSVLLCFLCAFFAACHNEANTAENDGFGGTYKVAAVKEVYNSSSGDGDKQTSYVSVLTMPDAASIKRIREDTIKLDINTTSVWTSDMTITKTGDSFTVEINKFLIDGEEAGDSHKDSEKRALINSWDEMYSLFSKTLTMKSNGTWTDNAGQASSGSFVVDEDNSKVKIITLVDSGAELSVPELIELSYSDGGKKFTVEEKVDDTKKRIFTFERK